jgi:hypothetical protein
LIEVKINTSIWIINSINFYLLILGKTESNWEIWRF